MIVTQMIATSFFLSFFEGLKATSCSCRHVWYSFNIGEHIMLCTIKMGEGCRCEADKLNSIHIQC